MTLKGANTDRLRFVLMWGLDQPELQSFFKQKKIALIQAGEKMQNLPEYQKDRITAILRFGQKASSLFEHWCQEKIDEPALISGDEIVARFEHVERDDERLGDEEKRLLSRSIIVHLTRSDPPESLLTFMRSKIDGEESADLVAAEDEHAPETQADRNGRQAPISPEDLSALASVMLARRPSREPLFAGSNQDLLKFALALRLATDRNWDALLAVEMELPEGSVYRNVLERALSTVRADVPQGVVQLPIRDVHSADEVDLEAIEVIAECNYVHPDGYIFFDPKYLLDSDGLVRCTKKVFTDLFPNNGSIMAFTNQLTRVPDEHSLGAWTVEQRETDKPIKVHVKASAEPIFEVFDIGVASDDYEMFRAAVSSPKHADTGRAIFRTTDKLLIRPRRDIADLIREGMKEPFDSWQSLSGFVSEGKTFVVGPLPQVKTTYDCSPLEQLLPRVLSIGNDVEGAPKLTKAEIKTIVETASDVAGKIDTNRLADVRERLDQYMQTSDGLEGILAQVIQNPKIQREIQEVKENASVQALSAREDLKQDIRNLQVERASLEKSLRQREIEQQQLPAKIGRAVRKAFAKAKDEGIEGLGELAVLAQLLGIGSSGGQKANEGAAGFEPELMWSQIEPEGGSLEDALTRFGVTGDSAPIVDSAIRISSAAGLILVFEGVAANAVAETTARALATKPAISTTITLGVYTPNQLREHVSKLGSSFGAIILKMANHSDLNLYAAELLEYATNRLADKAGEMPLIILTLSDGPSALPLPPRLKHLAIRVDLDEVHVGDASSGDSLRDVIEEAEKLARNKLWSPVRKRLVDSFEKSDKKPAGAVVSYLRSCFLERALSDE